MGDNNKVYVVQEIGTEKIILITRSLERVIDYLPTHAISCYELDKEIQETKQ